MGARGIAAVLAAVAGAVTARAQTCPAPAGAAPSLRAATASARHAFLAGALARERHRGRWWNLGWGWGFVAATAGQAAVGAAIDEDSALCRACQFVGAGKSAIGVVATWVLYPVRVRAVAPRAAPTCADVAAAERALADAAASERVPWLRHAEGIALNAAGVVYLGLAHDEWRNGLIGAAVGVAVGELRLWSRPRGAIAALRAYRAGRLAPARATNWHVSPTFGGAAGFVVTGTF